MSIKLKILIVEDQYIEAHNLERILIRAGYDVCSIAKSVPIALSIIENEKIDMVLLDIYLQGKLTGIDLAHSLKDRDIPFIYLSANSNKKELEQAKLTMPYGFLVKPFREKDVLIMLDIACYAHRKGKELSVKDTRQLTSVGWEAFPKHKRLITNSSIMREVLEQVNIAAQSNISVLILGESGTGKELIAKDIHHISKRRDNPFVVVNCSALPENLIESELFGHEKGSFTGSIEKRLGKFEQADGGTIFLDEIGELPIDMQVKFLRVLQEKEIEPIGGKLKKVNIRVIAATNRNLVEEIASGRFRMDLFYRLNVFPINMPPLRERKADIPSLAEYFINQFAKESGKIMTGISKNALESLMSYDWPGNVRELENVIFRSVLLNSGPIIENPSVLGGVTGKFDQKFKTIEENERKHIVSVLEECNWKVSGSGGAASLLNVKVSTLNSKIKKLSIKKPKLNSKNNL